MNLKEYILVTIVAVGVVADAYAIRYVDSNLNKHIKSSESTEVTTVSETADDNTLNINITWTYEPKTKAVTKVVEEVPSVFDSGISFNFHSYMDYRKITHTNSKQYELQQECWTDELGLRRHGSDYVIALGTYFSDTVGDRFKVYLDNGNSFYATVGDIKADSTTDEMNAYVPIDNATGNMVEFIIDDKAANTNMLMTGTVSYYDFFDGAVVGIERIDDK